MATTKRPTAPQDHLPAKSEAKREPIEFEYDGETYTVSADAADNLELFEAIEDEKYLSAMRGMIGPEGWEQYKNSHRNAEGRVPLSGFEEFLNAAMVAIGGANGDAGPN